MKLVKVFCFIMLCLIVISCEQTEVPTLNSRWRLIKVEWLDMPISSPARFLYYPAKPYVKEKPVFAFDADYQIWSWHDSLSIEYTIIHKGVELSDYSATPYTLVRDTIHFTNTRYGFQIFDNSLRLNGYGFSPFGKHHFTYYFEVEE